MTPGLGHDEAELPSAIPNTPTPSIPRLAAVDSIHEPMTMKSSSSFTLIAGDSQ
jgi:hypothetical protein